MANWTSTSLAFHAANDFLSCPFGAVKNGLRAFDFMRAQDGTYYFAVPGWTKTGRLLQCTSS